MITIYIGSCADDSIGIGTQIKGDAVRRSNGDYPHEIYYNGTWIECYDVLEVKVNSDDDIRYVVAA